jgi:cysteine desulfurase
MKKRIYLDHAASTPLEQKVERAMRPFGENVFGNPSSIYKEGREAKKAMDMARAEIAKTIGAHADEIIFTSGGTESDNLAIFGILGSSHLISSRFNPAVGGTPSHIITSKIEHHAVLNTCKALEKQGIEVTYLDVGKEGVVKAEDVKKAIKPNTILVSIMDANNEIGTIQPIAEIGKIIKNYRREKQSTYPYFHTDACQAAGYLDLDVNKLGVDLLTINGSKIYGPKGVGALYAKRGLNLEPMILGGEQERNKRAGTENVAGIVGLAEALKLAQKNRAKESARLEKLRDYFIKKLTMSVPDTYLNGSAKERLPNNINVSILGVEGEAMVLYLDEAGISASTGSACSSTSLDPSHVIMALGRSHLYSHGSLRFSLGKSSTKTDIDYVLKVLPSIVSKLRSISPVKYNAKATKG